MWWYVKQVSPREVHVYPSQQKTHRLVVTCPCQPEVRYGGGVKMIVHKSVSRSPLKPAFRAHWVRS